MGQIYPNNAATSFPKPDSVLQAVAGCLTELPQEPGRTVGNNDILADCRRVLADLFDVSCVEQIVLTPSATFALNTVIRGSVAGNSRAHVVTSRLEHNSVLRPLRHLESSEALSVTRIDATDNGAIDVQQVVAALRKETKLVCLTQASNVTGAIQPVAQVAEVLAPIGIPFLIDASQSAGVVPLEYTSLPGRVFVAIAGHKGLFGPAGTGVLIVPDTTLPQTFVGGTGIHSEAAFHPAELPLRHEAGTPNWPGIAGLAAGARYVLEQGLQQLGAVRHGLVVFLRQALNRIAGITLSPLAENDGRAGIVSFTKQGWSAEEIGFVLQESFGIVTRTGLHCAPLVRFDPQGRVNNTVRISVSSFTTVQELETLCLALNRLEVR